MPPPTSVRCQASMVRPRARSQRRANAAKDYLVARGIDASRIDITSYGEERPVDRAGTEDAFAKNRRDEFEIIAGGNALVRPQ